jgi:hypothetical protein
MRFINDYRGIASTRNCSFDSLWESGIEHSPCRVVRDIKAGQEILTDYGIGTFFAKVTTLML